MTLSTLAASPASSDERERLGAGELPAAAASSRPRPAVGEVHWEELGVSPASGLHERGDGLRRGSELASHACRRKGKGDDETGQHGERRWLSSYYWHVAERVEDY